MNVLRRPAVEQWWKGDVGGEMTGGFHLEATRRKVLTVLRALGREVGEK